MIVPCKLGICLIVLVSFTSSLTIHRVDQYRDLNSSHVAGIVLSFHDGGSYDHLLSTVKQTSK
jgi:hypothetical protein